MIHKIELVIIWVMVLCVGNVVTQGDGMSWEKARNLLQSGITSSGTLLAQNDPQRLSTLRDSINAATALIQEYRQNGLSRLPGVPNVPVVSTIASLPDKLIRAELSMLQDEIKMVQEMMDNPVSGTMNIPSNLANMFNRIAQQLSQ